MEAIKDRAIHQSSIEYCHPIQSLHFEIIKRHNSIKSRSKDDYKSKYTQT
jgi:hypothetical protein